MARVALSIHEPVHVTLTEEGAAAVNSFKDGLYVIHLPGKKMAAGDTFKCMLADFIVLFGHYMKPGTAMFEDAHIHYDSI